jgi:hypothetical protein
MLRGTSDLCLWWLDPTTIRRRRARCRVEMLRGACLLYPFDLYPLGQGISLIEPLSEAIQFDKTML